LPIMWSPAMQAGADVMKRIATPMIGGVVTSAILELLIYPVIYILWRRRELTDKTEPTAPLLPPALAVSHQARQRFVKWIVLVIGVIAIFYGGKCAWQKMRSTKLAGAPFVTQTINDLTVSLSDPVGELRKGGNQVTLEFRDGNGQLVDVSNVKFSLEMNMPGMRIYPAATVARTNTPGQYRAKIKIDMSGDWNAKISFDGTRGQGQSSFSITAN